MCAAKACGRSEGSGKGAVIPEDGARNRNKDAIFDSGDNRGACQQAFCVSLPASRKAVLKSLSWSKRPRVGSKAAETSWSRNFLKRRLLANRVGHRTCDGLTGSQRGDKETPGRVVGKTRV